MTKKQKEKIKEYHKQYYQKNKERDKEKIKEYHKQYNLNNKEKISLKGKEYYKKNKNKKKEYQQKNREHIRQRKKFLYQLNKKTIQKYNQIKEIRQKRNNYSKQYRQKNKKYFNQYERIRRKFDINHKIIRNLRSRLWQAIKGYNKSTHTKELLGCTIDQLKEHLQSKFVNGMSWENYGKGGWEIDHIRPCSSFDMSDPKEQHECFNYKNLQPLWWENNRKKGKNILN